MAPLDERSLRIAAATANLDERTALRALAGFPTRNHARDRLVAALSELGIAIPVPARDLSSAQDGR